MRSTLLHSFSFFIALFVQIGQAQGQNAAPIKSAPFPIGKASIAGKVLAEGGETLPFSNIGLQHLPDSAFVKFAVADGNGSFGIGALPEGSYVLVGTAVGYRKFVLGPVVLGADENKKVNLTLTQADLQQKETTVRAQRPMISVEPDKMVVNVENNPLMANSNAFDILRKSPGVFINQDDQIFLEGKQGLQIYIDGRRSPLSEKDLANYLKSLPSGAVESIELITNPSAKYEAAGNAGIINIKMKRNKAQGSNGSVNLGLSHGLANEYNYPKGNGSLSLNRGGKKLNLYSNYSYNYDKNWSFMNFDRYQNGLRFDAKTNSYSQSQSHNAKIGADFKANARNTFSLTADGNLNLSDQDSRTITPISQSESGDAINALIAQNLSEGNRRSGNLGASHAYKDTSGNELNTDATYGSYDLRSRTNQPNFYEEGGVRTDDISFGLTTPTIIGIATLKSDYERTIGKNTKLGAGYKLSDVRTNNTFQYYDKANGADQFVSDRSSVFKYKEQVAAAYISGNQNLGSKWKAQVGLRMEHTARRGDLTSSTSDSTNKKSYTNLFPSAGITFTPLPIHSFTASYSRRIDRPVYQYLNPFESKIDELSFEKGNPFLNPQYTNNYNLKHTFYYMLNTSVGYSHTRDAFARIVDTAGTRSFITRRNLADVKIYSVSISSPLPIRKWWNGYLSITANKQQNKGTFNGTEINLDVNYFNLYMQHGFTLPKEISIQLSGYYVSPSIWGGTFKTGKYWSSDASISKKFWKGRGTATLTLSDIFRSGRWTGVNDYGGTRILARGGYDSRTIRAGLNYNFGGQEQRRSRREAAAEEEKRRVNGGGSPF